MREQSYYHRIQDAGDDWIIAVCSRIIEPDRIAWHKHGDPADFKLVLSSIQTEPNRVPAVTDDQRKQDYLQEHLPYMLKMLRYTHGQMFQRQHYLSWNAHFESFAVHARNLVNFLTNHDTGNFKASDFVKAGYKARISDLSGAMNRLRDQVFHLGKTRPKEAVGKFSAEPDAKEVRDWIEKNFAEFLNKSELGSLFDKNKADPAKDDDITLDTGASAQFACTASPLAVQNQTTSWLGVSDTFGEKPKAG